jgi:hypothetical protein
MARRLPPPSPDYVRHVLETPKRLRCSLNELINCLNRDGTVTLPIELEGTTEADPDPGVELNVAAKVNVPKSWRASLKVNRQRVDGVDWHATEVKGAGCEPLSGWHRHVYDEAVGDAERNRVPIEDPAPDGKIKTFIESILKMMNVYIDAEAVHEQPELEFDP